MQTEVSVIIPTYNRAALVAQAIDSALGQTHRPLEVLVVDDGSTDDTLARLRAQFPNPPNLRVIALPANRGVYAARNEGLRQARGAWIAFLDADDWWRPEKLERQLAALTADPTLRAVHTDASLVDAEGRVLKPAANPKRQLRNGMVFDEFFAHNMAVILLSTVLLDRSCFDVTGLFNEHYRAVEDYGFFLRLAWHFPIGFLPEPLVCYRVTPHSLSRENAVRNVRYREEITRAIVAERRDYFAARPQLVDGKWQTFHRDSAQQLYYAGAYGEALTHFRKLRTKTPRLWAQYMLARLRSPRRPAGRPEG